jgi:hypothetical protein
MFQHDRTIPEFLYKAIFALNRCIQESECPTSLLNRWHVLAYETSATLSLLKQFLIDGQRMLTERVGGLVPGTPSSRFDKLLFIQ